MALLIKTILDLLETVGMPNGVAHTASNYTYNSDFQSSIAGYTSFVSAIKHIPEFYSLAILSIHKISVLFHKLCVLS